jgi:hypothetical protein
MAEMIANYQAPGKSPGATAASVPTSPSATPSSAPAATNGSGYLNEVSALNARSLSGENH